MDLLKKTSARQRSKCFMRLGCCLVIVSLLLGLALPPKAEAFAVTGTAIAAIAGGFLAACGLPFLVKGVKETGLADYVDQLLQEWLDEEKGLVSEGDWLKNFGEEAVVAVNGTLVLAKSLADDLRQFAVWVSSKYGTKPGENVVYNQQGFTAVDGTYYELGQYVSGSSSFMGTNILKSTVVGTEWTIPLSQSLTLTFRSLSANSTWDLVYVYDQSGSTLEVFDLNQKSAGWYYTQACFILRSNNEYLYIMSYSPDPTGTYINSRYKVTSFGILIPADLDILNSSLALDVAESLTIPGELTDDQSIALDVGATDSMTVQEILQGILDAILAGDLTASAEIVDAAEIPVEPPAEEVPDVDGLGLPALGAALVSRFPFCIPWDVAKGVQLLAAPAKAPYFEVDFLAPISDRVGGWKGSTKIVLDMSQYEIIGQVCRWTSTIGFCLMLAGGTKRLIWTA